MWILLPLVRRPLRGPSFIPFTSFLSVASYLLDVPPGELYCSYSPQGAQVFHSLLLAGAHLYQGPGKGITYNLSITTRVIRTTPDGSIRISYFTTHFYI